MTIDGKPIEQRFGDVEGRPMPSVIAIDKQTGKVYSGREARDKRTELAEKCVCITSIKSLLQEDGWSCKIAGRIWTAEDVVYEIFKALKHTVDSNTHGDSFSSATVAVPIGFAGRKREVIKKAALRAGINIESFVSEPTAAFFANQSELEGLENIIVFDWGGGTLDVSAIRHANGRITELATDGMPVAGDAIDESIARAIHSQVVRNTKKVDVRMQFDQMPASDRDKLLFRAERAKINLGVDDETVVSLNRYGAYGTVRERLSYGWFKSIVENIVKEALAHLDKAMNEAGLNDETVDAILLVGGTSNLGPLLDVMEERFGDKLVMPEGTVWSISRGAAMISELPGEYRSAQDIDIVLADGSHYHLMEKDDLICDNRKTAYFALVDETSVAQIVFSGSKDIDASSDKARVVDLKTYGFLEEKLQVDSFIDVYGVFRVTIKSTMRPSSDKRIWEYDNLKTYYLLPEGGR
jgi:molecular chaperone DnaK